MTKLVALCCLHVCSVGMAFTQSGPTLWGAFSQGFATPSSSSLNVQSVAGQTFVGTGQSTHFRVVAGVLSDTLVQQGVPLDVAPPGELPGKIELCQNSPNPFNPATTIRYAVPSSGRVELVVFSILGERVATLVDEVKTPGYYLTSFDAHRYGSGVYFYRLATSGSMLVRKMIALK
jgi:hypothetical protein